MYTQEQKAAMGKFEALVKTLGSQNKAAQQIGMTGAVMSQLRNETYPGDVNAQLQKVVDYFAVKDSAAALPSARFTTAYNYYVPTSFSSSIYGAIHNCQMQGGLAVCAGDAGIGKTKAAKKFAEEHQNDAVYLSLNPCLKGIKSLLTVLCERMNVSERAIDRMWLGLTGRFRDGMILIIDEAQHLPIKTIEMLRAFSDHFADKGQTFGVCFIGNEETVSFFSGRQRAGFAQITNRTRQRWVLSAEKTQRKDIEILFPELADPDAIEFLLTVARSKQAVRGAVNLYNNALDNDNTSYTGIVAMAKHMQMSLA